MLRLSARRDGGRPEETNMLKDKTSNPNRWRAEAERTA